MDAGLPFSGPSLANAQENREETMKNILLAVACLFITSTAEGQISREEWRARWLDSRGPSRITIEPAVNDRAEDLVDELRYRSLAEMEKAGLRRARIQQPWSDSYWPIYGGMIANRYGDPEYRMELDWDSNQRFLLAALGKGPTERFSPAEKYDLLMGDRSFTLTRKMIGEGRRYYEHSGSVETWMGLCHGWAAASFMMERPSSAVDLPAPDGTLIRFYPSDVKALATLLWSNGRFPVRFIGGRCNIKNPPRDERGRPREQDCLDTNPGTWHLAVVNQLGHAGRPLILDISYDYEVWNQPAFAYYYSFVDPLSGAKVDRLEDAIHPLTSADPRRDLRAPGTVSLVRVAMSVEYVLEREPEPLEADSSARDALGNALYQYELELDARGEIVGGEWLQRAHPDFLWVPAPGVRASSVGDWELNRSGDRTRWDYGSPVPGAWKAPALRAAEVSQPLARVVERLVFFSARGIRESNSW
jgi:hypothetical protein